MSLEEFFAGLDYRPDPFQTEAAAALEAGESVVVTAPTGAGKTLVAEAGIHLSLERGERVFYTTPLKALSNQKYRDFSRALGESEVGLLTGDNSLRGGAPLVVMTTEVLRNMIYAGSAALAGLGLVILDEVHYLQDRFRGMVWEEVIIHLPAAVQIACLSATIANPEEFTGWVESRRGSTRLILERRRPVPLEGVYLFKQRFGGGALDGAPLFAGGERHPNRQLERLLRHGRNRHGRFGTPRRTEVAGWLAETDLLPAIYFVFSRKGCDEAASAVASGMRLTTPDERAVITEHAAARTSHLPSAELTALGYGPWLDNLQRGVAAHHAGLVPALKETVEDLFAAGLLKIVFATETLALGINMPARSVVLDKLSRFTGESHELLQPGDYTQLTGRAGRRGIDDQGTAIVLHSRFVPFDRVVAIAGPGAHPLRSSFRPNYNMAVNLVANYERRQAEAMLEASFGQYQLETRRKQLAARRAELAARLEAARSEAACDLGDIWTFAVDGPDGHATRMRAFARELEIGDVLQLVGGGADQLAVMLARGFGSHPRLLLLSADGRLRRIGPEELPAVVARVGRIDLPDPYRPREKRFQRSVLTELRRAEFTDSPLRPEGGAAAGVGACPDLPLHLEAARRARRLQRDLERTQRRERRRADGLLAEFTAILTLLQSWGYAGDWTLTEAGEALRGIYNEADLLVVETVRRGVLEPLDAAETAALMSVFVYDPRSDGGGGPLPTPASAQAWHEVESLAAALADAEARGGITPSRAPDSGFAAAAYAWAAGAELEDLVDDDLSGGDFVRTCRQTIDLLRQAQDTFGETTRAGAGASLLDRGVVAAGGIG